MLITSQFFQFHYEYCLTQVLSISTNKTWFCFSHKVLKYCHYMVMHHKTILCLNKWNGSIFCIYYYHLGFICNTNKLLKYINSSRQKPSIFKSDQKSKDNQQIMSNIMLLNRQNDIAQMNEL